MRNNRAFEIVLNKIDLFMQKNIIPSFNPSKIYWWFSLSGGKDSFVMAHSINEWYKRNKYSFFAEGFCVCQWSKNTPYTLLKKQVTWMPVTVIDGTDFTNSAMNYTYGKQAPCGACSSIRKKIGDSYISNNYKNGFTNIIARGLHLSDMAISYLWRSFWDIDIDSFSKSLNKGHPLVKLNIESDVYLAKPLCYVREYETQEYSKAFSYFSICCGCPACRFPSRRDIVEESLKLLFSSDKWEFEVYGIKDYLSIISGGTLINDISLAGIEKKRAHIPIEFYDYILERFLVKLPCKSFHSSIYLDDIGIRYLIKHEKYDDERIFQSKLYSNQPLTISEKSMIATVGPFWGCVGYKNKSLREYLLKLQNDIYQIQIDQLWSQVIPVLNDFYLHNHYHFQTCCLCDFQ